MKYLVVSSFAAIIFLLSIPSAHAQVFGKNLSFGMQGNPAVSELQDFLTAQNLYSGPTTGNFYFLTLNAVKAFQTQQGISPAAGYFGPLTRAAAEKIAGGEISASNAQAIAETGSAFPPPSSNSSTVQLQLEALLKQIASLQRQLANQQQTNQAIQNPQIQVQQPLQQTQQNTQPIPQTVPPPVPITPVPAPTSPSPPPAPAPITVGTLNVARSGNFSADMDISQTCSIGCGLTKIAEFAITASSEAIQLNNVSIELMASPNTSMGTNNSRLQGVRMMVNGTQFGITLASPYPYGSPYGMITFSGSPLTIGLGQTAIIDITAGVATAASLNTSSTETVTVAIPNGGINATGLSSHQAIVTPPEFMTGPKITF